MKKVILIGFVIIFSFGFSKAQTSSTPDPRLLDVYPQEYLDINQEGIEYLNWFLDNSYVIMYTGLEKAEFLEFLYEINPITKQKNQALGFDEEDFNPLLYSFDIHYDKSSSYRIGNTGYIIIFDSLKTLTENYNQYKNENQ
ncbi:MAG: hypothetical protein GX793_00680 [Bacteroidales bacterium]|jgi:hypothetical protein|nr:hypothetical protein [Bacteroidales bacterium]NLB85555.1 hypothetical protein [Bacteroidales bacterium]